MNQQENEVFSTPPTTPGPGLLAQIIPTLSRKSSRPISLNIDRKQQSTFIPDIELATSPDPTMASTKPTCPVPPAMAKEDPTIVPQPVTKLLDQPTLQQYKNAVTSPCFVHSYLDKGAHLTDWLRNKLVSTDVSDVGVSKSLHRMGAPSDDLSPPSSETAVTTDSGFDYDAEYGDSLTKRLAETAVGVREMSKQLGRARIPSNMQNILIVTKARDNRLIKLTRQLALYLMMKQRPGAQRGMVVYVDSQLRRSKRFDAEGLKREHPEFFVPYTRRTSSTHSLSSNLSESTHTEHNDDGQLRYWTSSMCRHSPHLFDFVITLGGDGTVLFTSWLFQQIVPPVLPFALGSLGFLTNFDFGNHQKVMDNLMDNGIRVNLRMRFTCTVYRAVINKTGKGRKAYKRGQTGEIMMKNIEEGGWEALESGNGAQLESKLKRDKEIMCFTTRPVETFEVLNDLVVDRGPSPYVSLLELFGDNHHMTTVQADGLTVSTPTGSTAYSLSAGGSLVHPEIPAILITPICPHTLSFRPMLLPDTMELRICVPYNSRSTAWASFDGRGRVELKQGDHIKVTASKYPFPTVCADSQSTDWFNSISRTLKWNERERQKSFVVVEEDAPPKGRTKNNKKPPAPISEHDPLGDDDEEDDWSSGEEEDEEEKFDIDDSSPEGDSTSGMTPTDSEVGIEKTKGNNRPQSRRRQSKSRSKSRSRTGDLNAASTSSSPQSGVASPTRFATEPPHPPTLSPRHVGFDLPGSPASTTSSDSLVSDIAQVGTRDDLRAPRYPSGRSRIPRDRDLEFDFVRTPTAGSQHGQGRGRGHPQSDHRAFAVWGHDESDSNASDTDP
ncbi:ATP-NAD kinase-like domain-containing protein [Crepidotus variabilis]|uniref:ATP-NAD kinase-like domain-containing protein n=1 Tax=Crepidotus variabilis TaxID=179855 RepID=A0A9P6JR79_9AGAR|nr:ATP-NAD kinase-like domain-containing protein [Crepidotus variabilis]